MMMKRTWLFGMMMLACGLVAAASAQAQIAAPSLLPATTTDNPAAIHWAGPSHFALASLNSDFEIEDPGNVPPEYGGGGGGQFVGFRLVSSVVSFAVLQADFEGDTDLGGRVEYDTVIVNLTIGLGDSLSLGLGHEGNSSNIATDPSGGFQTLVDSDSSLPLLGLSWRIGGVFYLGLAYGTETAEGSLSFSPVIPGYPQDFHYERDVWKYGLALRGGTTSPWHIEVGAVEKEATTDTLLNLPIKRRDEQFVTVELSDEGVMVGFKAVDSEETDESVSPNLVTKEESKRELALGWAPQQGWSVVLVAAKEDITEGTRTQVNTTTTAVLSYFF